MTEQDDSAETTTTTTDGSAELARLRKALATERAARKAAESEVAKWRDIGDSPDDIAQKLDRMPELEAAAEGKGGSEAIEKAVHAKLQAAVAPHERKARQLAQQLKELEATRDELTGKVQSFTIESAVSKLVGDQIRPEARGDVVKLLSQSLMVDADGEVIGKDGQPVDQVWSEFFAPRAGYLGVTSTGGGARGQTKPVGSSKVNPWARETWSPSQQADIQAANPQEAIGLAQSVGSSLGAMQPPPPRA